MKIKGSIEIATPPEKIWLFLVEPDKKLKWATIIEEFDYTSDKRSGVGAPFYFVLRGRKLIKVQFIWQEWVENKKLVARMTSSDFIKNYTQVYELEPTQYGTRLNFAEDIKWPYGIFGIILGRIMKRRVEDAVGEMLVVLKELAEA